MIYMRVVQKVQPKERQDQRAESKEKNGVYPFVIFDGPANGFN